MNQTASLEVRALLDAINGLPCGLSRQLMLRTLRSLAGRRLYITRRDIVAPEQVALAVSLLNTMRVSEARDALMVRLGCERTKAYAVISAALQARRKAVTVTHVAEPDDGID